MQQPTLPSPGAAESGGAVACEVSSAAGRPLKRRRGDPPRPLATGRVRLTERAYRLPTRRGGASRGEPILLLNLRSGEITR